MEKYKRIYITFRYLANYTDTHPDSSGRLYRSPYNVVPLWFLNLEYLLGYSEGTLEILSQVQLLSMQYNCSVGLNGRRSTPTPQLSLQRAAAMLYL